MAHTLILAGRTGHNHTLVADGAKLTLGETAAMRDKIAHWRQDDPDILLSVVGTGKLPHGGVLEHETHGHINLPPGSYAFYRQIEFDPWSNRNRAVFD